jgi:hypothetical protein
MLDILSILILYFCNKKTPASIQRQKLFRGSTLFIGFKIRYLIIFGTAYHNTITGVTAGVYSFSIQYSRMHFSKFNLKSLSAYEDFSL